MARSAYTALIWIIMSTHITAPTSDMYQRERKVGRYDGFPAKYSRNATEQRVPYVTMKNMLRIWAMKSMSPSATNTAASVTET